MPNTNAADTSSANETKPTSAQALFSAWLSENIRPGERYCGVVLAADGTASHHLLLLPGDKAGLTWSAAQEWAKKAGGELPTRGEQSILFGNAKGEFKRDWYWSGEQHASGDGSAWIQGFYGGRQYGNSKSAKLRARAVRRLPI